MAKKNIEHGALYKHAEEELKRAGITIGKGNLDQKIYHTVLKLIDTYERAAETELIADTIGTLFNTLSRGELISSPTDDPDEWKLVPGLGEGVMILRRCNAFRSNDGGITWYRNDTGASGVSIVTTEETDDGSQESTEDIQPAKG